MKASYTRPEVTVPASLDYALKISHKVCAGFEQWYFLISDAHLDSPESYIRLYHKHMAQVVERNALVLDFGDMVDAVNSREDPRGSKGGIRLEHVKLHYLDALCDWFGEELKNYADNYVYVGTGNHEQAISVRRETDIGGRIVQHLNTIRTPGLPPIHRAGYTGWIRFMFEHRTNGSNRSSHFLKGEHGTGGNSPVTKGTIQAHRRSARTEGATFFASGHIHEKWSMSHVIETPNLSTGQIQQREVKHIQLGAYKMDFRPDGGASWAMMKMGNPKPIGGAWLRFYTDNGKDIQWEVTDAAVNYEKLDSYLRKSKVQVIKAGAA